MRKLLLTTIVFFTFLAIGCQKEDDPKPDPSKEELLVEKNWSASEITFVADNALKYYKRGGSNNTWDFTNDVITFKANGTGTYKNTATASFNISWQFIDAAKTRIRYTIFDYDKGVSKPGTNLVVNWENVTLSATSMSYSEIYTNSDNKSVITAGTRVTL